MPEPENGHGSGGEGVLAGREAFREAVAGHGGPSSPERGGGNGHNDGNGGNGHNGGHGGHGAAVAESGTLVAGRRDLLHETVQADALNAAMSRLMGDAPTCTCGSITVRNGSCYKCLNCGASLGCS